jgi:hypothetical protein
MSLEITATLVQVMQEVTGQGQKGPWVKQEFVVETTADKFPKKICFSLWGEKTSALKDLKPGTPIKVFFNLESREYQGRWYTEARAWQIGPASQNAGQAATSAPVQSAASTTATSVDEMPAGGDDLPF